MEQADTSGRTINYAHTPSHAAHRNSQRPHQRIGAFGLTAAGRQAVDLGPAERPGRGARGVRREAPHDLRLPVPDRSRLPAQISRQLNKGESIHALKLDPIYAHEGAFRARHLEAQTGQSWCLTLAANAVITWTAEHYGIAADQMRRQGRRIDDEVLAHISPARSANINFFG